jgi:hypothetical protein
MLRTAALVLALFLALLVGRILAFVSYVFLTSSLGVVFRLGALRLPRRGDDSFDFRTNSSIRAFGTASKRFMMNVIGVFVVEAKSLFVKVAGQVKRFDRCVSAAKAGFRTTQKFSRPFAWTLPRT